jgi:hypothetical protein
LSENFFHCFHGKKKRRSSVQKFLIAKKRWEQSGIKDNEHKEKQYENDSYDFG